jgi:hypothetical protein
MQRLARNDGEGGALGAALYLVSDQAGRKTVTETVDQARAWRAAHGQIFELQEAGGAKRRPPSPSVATAPRRRRSWPSTMRWPVP